MNIWELVNGWKYALDHDDRLSREFYESELKARCATLTIAVDFDGTLCENAYPFIGAPRWDVIKKIKMLQKCGAKLILFTCRCGIYLDKAVQWCLVRNIIFESINDSLPKTIEKYGSRPKKVSADLYIDDRSVCP